MSQPMERNGRSTGILSDGTRVNVYRYQGAGNEWTAALHYPDGGYSSLVLSGRSAEFDEHNVEGTHMGTLIPWDAVPGNIKRDIEQRAVESSMVANGRAETEYRGLQIEAIENATQLGYHTGEGMRRRRGKGRNIGRQYLIHLGEVGSGGTKIVSTMRAAREYIDDYLGPEHTANGRATTVDPVAARELDRYIANTFELIGAPNSIGKSIDANLRRKLASGKYDPALAPKAWQYLVDEGAKRYQKEFGSDSPIFNAATRRQVAADFARAWESESGMQPNGSPVRPGEKLVGKAIGQHGQVLATFKGDAIRPLIARLDAAHPNSWGASISGEYTSDGTHHGPGKGRVVASREPRTVDGRFYSGWIIE